MRRVVVALSAFVALIAFGCGSDEPASSVANEDTPVPTTISRIAFASNRDGNFEVYIMNADGSGQRNLTNHPALDSRPAWSPDGAKLAFFSDRDGSRDIYAMDADGSNVVRLTDNPASDHTPAWSPDGDKIAFVSDRAGRSQIWTMNADGSGQRVLTPRLSDARTPAWTPDGLKISFAAESSIWTIDPDATGARRIINSRHFVDRFFAGWPDWAPNGLKLALTSNLRDPSSVVGTLYTSEPDGFHFARFLPEHTTGESPSWSPDSQMLAYSALAEGGNWDIWVVDVGTKASVRITDHEALDSVPAWEPRGIVPPIPE
jgi:TolB protein